MSNLGTFVWSIADQLRGVYKPHQYGGVILPFTILRRLDCIASYVWLLDTTKAPERKGKVQLVDATSFWTKIRKNLGAKNREIGAADRAKILKRTTTSLRLSAPRSSTSRTSGIGRSPSSGRCSTRPASR